MNKKSVLLISGILALFILGGVIGITHAAAVRQENADTQDEALHAQMTAREASYNELIATANQKIEELNNQVTAMQNGGSVISGEQTISAKEAVDLARQSLDEESYLLHIPELASYQDHTIFNVSFTSGSVYVDAFSGEILYSSVPKRIDEQQAIKIAGDYLGLSDTSGAVVLKVQVEGSDFYKVTIGGTIFYIDAYGNITKIQTVQYVAPSAGSGSSSSGHSDDDYEDEHEEDDD